MKGGGVIPPLPENSSQIASRFSAPWRSCKVHNLTVKSEKTETSCPIDGGKQRYIWSPGCVETFENNRSDAGHFGACNIALAQPPMGQLIHRQTVHVW